ncbi:hypothetical protein F7725_015467 [Dissostichus mawsoni]|uniref:Uncharacterized protein n=1 Tax=Dissostichus mawsoni TaxID=36200 RepID=A0A7J5YHV6_DISMA|nr:hypothetical protein F7725_015467 [Dissostichus mawsoni]
MKNWQELASKLRTNLHLRQTFLSPRSTSGLLRIPSTKIKNPASKNLQSFFLRQAALPMMPLQAPRKTPPNSLALGPAPAKPNRPHKVDLESIKRGAVASDNGPGSFKKPTLPIPSHASIHSNNMTPLNPFSLQFPGCPRTPWSHVSATLLQGKTN